MMTQTGRQTAIGVVAPEHEQLRTAQRACHTADHGFGRLATALAEMRY